MVRNYDVITANQLVHLMVPVIFLSLCGCHDNPLLYSFGVQKLLLCTDELLVDSGLLVQLKNFLKQTKSSVGVLLFLLFKAAPCGRYDNGRRAGMFQLLETIRFADVCVDTLEALVPEPPPVLPH